MATFHHKVLLSQGILPLHRPYKRRAHSFFVQAVKRDPSVERHLLFAEQPEYFIRRTVNTECPYCTVSEDGSFITLQAPIRWHSSAQRREKRTGSLRWRG